MDQHLALIWLLPCPRYRRALKHDVARITARIAARRRSKSPVIISIDTSAWPKIMPTHSMRGAARDIP